MREGKRYACPQCGDLSPVGVSCARCNVTMIDENGNPPLKPKLPRPSFVISEWMIGGVASLGIGWVTLRNVDPQGAAAAVGLAVAVGLLAVGGALVWLHFATPRMAVRRDAARRRVRAEQMAARAGPVAPIGEAKGDLVRVRGRVKVLRAADAPATVGRCAVHEDRFRGDLESGRFAVADASGLAIVDDDCIEVWRRGSSDFDEPGGDVLDGADVEILGPAASGPAPDVAALGESAYRQFPEALIFDGRPDRPVLVIV